MFQETSAPGENHRLTPSHWQLSRMPGWNSKPGSDESQLAVSGNALDRTAIRASPLSIEMTPSDSKEKNAKHEWFAK